jgi:bla regulator protein BlaR1
VVLNWQAPAETLIKPLTQPDYWQWATVVFWAGHFFSFQVNDAAVLVA